MVPHGNAAVVKRTLRPVVKAVAALAGVVFLCDNHLSGTSGLILLASIAVLALCGIVWMIFLRDDDQGGFTGRLTLTRDHAVSLASW
jgi:dolichyl-phosphate-mannose--protein O-mannosyl transferase